RNVLQEHLQKVDLDVPMHFQKPSAYI
ncbi:MAG: hypothetical protein K0S75_1969, partial [Clostridia bacterium]|nr:hypothetical protein [Clostridia bacterium]